MRFSFHHNARLHEKKEALVKKLRLNSAVLQLSLHGSQKVNWLAIEEFYSTVDSQKPKWGIKW